MVASEAGQREAERKTLDVDGVRGGRVRVAERTDAVAVGGRGPAADLQKGVGTDGTTRGLRNDLAFGGQRERVAACCALEKANHGFAFVLRHETQIAAALNAGNQMLGDHCSDRRDGERQLGDAFVQKLDEGVAKHVLLRVDVLIHERHLADTAVHDLLEVHAALADRRAFPLHMGAEIRLVQRVLEVHVRLHQRQTDVRRSEPIGGRFLRVVAVLDGGDVLGDRGVGPDPFLVHQRDQFGL